MADTRAANDTDADISHLRDAMSIHFPPREVFNDVPAVRQRAP